MTPARKRAGRASAVGILTMLLGALLALAPSAEAAPAGVHKVKICHRTDSVTNPYVINTVDFDSTTGLEIDRGRNHTGHTGDVFVPPDNGGEKDWGDIIPPVPYGDPVQFTDGVNWEGFGEAIYYGKDNPQTNDPVQCVVPGTDPDHSLTVVKLNDADRDGAFTENELAPAALADVTFQIAIENTGSDPLTLTTLDDDFPGSTVDLLDLDSLDCERDGDPVTLTAGDSLPAGSETICTFTLTGYAPTAGGSITNTVTVGTDEVSEAESTSIVRSPSPILTCVDLGDCPQPTCVELGNCPQPTCVELGSCPEPVAEADPSNLTVKKSVTGDAPEDGWSFPFTVTDLGGFDLTDTSGSSSHEVDAGTYTITETDAGGATLASVDCTGTDTEVVDVEAGTATVTVAEDDSIICTFTNEFPTLGPAAAVSQPESEPDGTEVLGSKVVRTLPRTGAGSDKLAAVGVALMMLGGVIAVGGRRGHLLLREV